MTPPIAFAALAIVIVGAFMFYQAQQAAAERARIANSPGAMIGSGIGNLVGGIIGLATGSGGST